MLAAMAVLVSGCSSFSYYSQLASGEYDLLHRRQSIQHLVEDPATPPGLRQRLRLAQEGRAFASDHLDLPRNGSYTQYADLGREAAVWNVFATPEFSLAARESCFWIAGCVAYRGFFHEEAANAHAKQLGDGGDDVWVSAIPTYSTLGWFDDPVLNTMIDRDDLVLLGEMFHELAHQKLYVRDDTAFNESFAMFVQEEGEREWCTAHGQPAPAIQDRQRWKTIVTLVMQARDRLTQLYRSDLPDADKRTRKQAEFERLRNDYKELRDKSWAGYHGYDGWFAADMNNATLLPFGLYDQWVPAFAALFRQNGGDWKAFFAAAREISRGSHVERRKALRALAPDAGEGDE